MRRLGTGWGAGVVVAAVAGLVVVADARFQGGGRPSGDCLVEYDGLESASRTTVECSDGDPSCDADGACDGACEFQMRVCLNQCPVPPFPISRIQVTGAVLEMPPLPATTPACGGHTSVRVPASPSPRGRRRKRQKPTFKLIAFGSGRQKLDKDKVSLVCRPRADACPGAPEVKDDTVASLPALRVDPPSPAGGSTATVTFDLPGASNAMLTATGDGCGGFAAAGPGTSPMALTRPVGVWGACDIAVDADTPSGPRTLATRFEVTPTNLVLPDLEVIGASFVPGGLPASSANPAAPMIAAINGPTNIINGGSVQLRIQLQDPSRAGDVRTVQVQAIGAGGYPGYFETPATLDGSDVVLELSLASAFAASSVDSQVQLVDRFGNVGNAVPRSLNVVQVGAGEVQVSLSWDTPTDVDLHVVEPTGEELYYGARNSSSGGTLDLDSNPACSIDGINNENVTWSGTPPLGRYIVRVDFWEDCGGQDANFTVTVRYCGLVETFRGTFPPGSSDHGGAGSGRFIRAFDTNCPARVRGRAVYEDFPQTPAGLAPAATLLPIRFAKLAVRRAADGEVLAEATTRQDGSFDVPFSNNGDPGYFVELTAEQSNATVSQRVLNDTDVVYSMRSGTIDESVERDKVLELVATADGIGPAFNIFDAGVTGAMLVQAVQGATPPALDWLWTRGKRGTCVGQATCYQADANRISVLSLPADPDEYDDLVLLHAYGHFYQHLHSRSDGTGGEHHAVERAEPRLAWSEGSATFFAGVAKQSSLYLDTVPGGVRARVDLETPAPEVPLGTSDGGPTGALSEGLVGAVLWDLFDPTGEAKDTLARRDAVFGALGYLGSSRFIDRGAPGADLLDALDGWFCLGYGDRGDATSGVEGNAVGLHAFPYDFPALGSCR